MTMLLGDGYENDVLPPVQITPKPRTRTVSFEMNGEESPTFRRISSNPSISPSRGSSCSTLPFSDIEEIANERPPNNSNYICYFIVEISNEILRVTKQRYSNFEPSLKVFLTILDTMPENFPNQITYVDLSDTNLTKIPVKFLQKFPNLKILNISNNQLRSLKELLDLKQKLDNPLTIYAQNNLLTHKAVKTFLNHRHMTFVGGKWCKKAKNRPALCYSTID